MPIWGRKRKEAEEALSQAKALIIKVKKRGIDTSHAERMYREAKSAIKNRRYSDAFEGIEKAKKSARKAYVKAVKERLKLRISGLEEKLKEMQAKNLDLKGIERYLKRAKASREGGIKDHKNGLKSAKKGVKLAEDVLGKLDTVLGLLAGIAAMFRRIEEQSPDLEVLSVLKKRHASLQDQTLQGKIESTLKGAKQLDSEVSSIKEKHGNAYESIKALEKAMKDANVLGAHIDASSQIEDARSMLTSGKFESACIIADRNKEELTAFLNQYKDAQYHVDCAQEKVLEVKNWGFSAFEAERALDSAKEALGSNKFEAAIELSKQSRDKAGTVRERHKRSLELISSAKDEVEKIKVRGIDVSGMEESIKEAEDEFNKGDYSTSDETINGILEEIKGAK